jgi:hypothetical protein
MTSLFQILMLLLDVAFFIVIAHVILSWLINFGVLNLRQPIVAQIWDGLNRLLEPVYSARSGARFRTWAGSTSRRWSSSSRSTRSDHPDEQRRRSSCSVSA